MITVFIVITMILVCFIQINSASANSLGEGRWDFSFEEDVTISKNELPAYDSGDRLYISSSIVFHGYVHSGTADVILSVTDPDGTEKQHLQKLHDMKIDEIRKISFEYFPENPGKYSMEIKIIPPDGINEHVFDKKTISYDFGVIDLDSTNKFIKLKMGKSEITKIFGNVAKYFTLDRYPIYTTMIFPDGSESYLKTRIASSGYFEVPMLFDEKSMPGVYQFVTRYQDYQSEMIKMHVRSLYS